MTSAADLAAFKALIRERCGLLFEGDGEAKLAAALRQRSAAAGTGSGADYYARLRASECEFQDLINLLTVNETYFYREPDQIRLLAERIVPRLLAQRSAAAPLRILSAGCSSGEEPYTVVMALHQRYGAAVTTRFAFHAGDIDSSVLTKARAARYSEFSFRGVPAAIRERYFERDEWAYTLKEEIRRCVDFHELNLLAPQFPPQLQGFDVILFRNVSIYFDAATRQLIQRQLASLLNPDGVLLTGTAETLANDFGVMTLVEEDGLFYFVKGQRVGQLRECGSHALLPLQGGGWELTHPHPGPPLEGEGVVLGGASTATAALHPAKPSQSLPPLASTAATPPFNLTAAIRLTREKRYDEVLPQLERRLGADAHDSGALLLQAHILLNRMDFAAAERAAASVLERDPWSVDALLLLGQVAKWRNQADAAIRHFKQAVYTRHECWPAHYYLADLHRMTNAQEPARREYRIVLQLLSGNAPDIGVRVVPLDLPVAEIRFLCEHQLAKLAGQQSAATVR